MAADVVDTWSYGDQNTKDWLHDGDVERSAADIIDTAENVAALGEQITAAAAQAVLDVNAAGSEQMAAIEGVTASQVAIVEAAGTAQAAAVAVEGASQIAAVADEAAGQVAAVQSAGSTQTAAVQSAGAAQISAVEAEGTTQITSIQAEGAALVADAEAARDDAVSAKDVALASQAAAATAAAQAAASAAEAMSVTDFDKSQHVNTKAWANTVDYSPGAIAAGSDGNLYVALQANTAVNPVGDASGKWGLLVPQTGPVLTVHGGQAGRALVLVDNDKDGEDEDHRIALESNSAGNAGIYDYTNGKWLIWSDKDGINRLPGNTAIYSPDNGASYLHNLSYATALDVRDFGAVGDGVTDDYAAIQAALDRAHTTKKMLVIPAGTYLIERHIEFKSDTTVIGYGATILRGYDIDAAGYGSTAWLIRDSAADPVCRNVRIYGLTFDNNCQNFHQNSQNVITIGPVVSNLQFHAENVWFVNCTFQHWINQHALDVAATKGLHVIGCTFRDVLYIKEFASDMFAWRRWEAIQLDCAGWNYDAPLIYDQDWVIEGNVFEAHSGQSITFPAGYEWPNGTVLDSDKTVFFEAPHTGIGQHSGPNYVNAGYKNIKILNNIFRGCMYAGITLYGVTDSIVSGNILDDCFYGIEINARLSCSNNTLYRFATDNVQIVNNRITKPSTSTWYKYSGTGWPLNQGVTVYADGITFKPLIINYSTEFTANFSGEKVGPSGIMLKGNTISGYYRAGFSGGVFESVISGNYISDCAGVFLLAGTNVEIVDNYLMEPGYGIRSSSAEWVYAPNDNNADVQKFITIKDNVIVTNTTKATVINFDKYSFVNVTGNVFYDNYELAPDETQDNHYYLYVMASSGSVVANNTVYAKSARRIQAAAGLATGNAVRNNDWFVNGVLQS